MGIFANFEHLMTPTKISRISGTSISKKIMNTKQLQWMVSSKIISPAPATSRGGSEFPNSTASAKGKLWWTPKRRAPGHLGSQVGYLQLAAQVL
jgi:hypothetical protein